ncbi:MAG TPA: hypothetical protein VGF48_21340 [Thermoanaerobaculia bacterium]
MERLRIKRPSARVGNLVRAYVGDHPGFLDLFERFLALQSYDRGFAEECARAARVSRAWSVRRVATLMLEHLLLREHGDHAFWSKELGVDLEPLLPRLARNARLQRPEDFLHIASKDCRLTLARYLFTPEEIIERIERHLRRSQGIRSQPDYGHNFVRKETAHILRMAQPLERTILEHLGRDATIRWVDEATRDEINSLVEYPLGTVVTVIKPPGSDQEIEIKRTGVRGPLPFDAIYERGGYIVPASHHLHGGAMEHLLALETSHSSILSRLYRRVHGHDAPMSRTLSLATIYTIPSPAGEVDLLDYFTDRRVFRDRYERMRSHMARVNAEMARQTKTARLEQVNELSQTIEFLGLMKPAQAVQFGTTSFRLERLGTYLGPQGAERYFRTNRSAERRVDYTNDDARRFADELLDEILCVYQPPDVPFRSYRKYLDAAYAVPANRKRASRNYRTVMAQIGRFWGTMLAARGHSTGESFVARNCGLRSVFEDGEWKINVVFMDHDSLTFASRYEHTYNPRYSVRNAAKDAKFILGGYFDKNYVRGELDYLRDIYRVSPALEIRGRAAFRAAMRDAYRKTQKAMHENPEVREMFKPRFVRRLGDWDEVVRRYLRPARTARQRERRKQDLDRLLIKRGYGRELRAQYIDTLVKQRHFLRTVSFLF